MVLVGLAGAMVLLASSPAQGRLGEDERRAIEAIKKVKPSVVRVDTLRPGSNRPGVGSGLIIRRDGFIITNFHVIRKAQLIHVWLASGKMYPARVWKASADRDLAVLKVDAADLPVPQFGNSEKLELGQMAIAIGSPLRFSWSVTIGIISALGRQVPTHGVNYHNLIQTDAAINPGSSGGALCNSAGEVIGINTLVYTGNATYRNAQGLAFAIPINDALRIAQALVGKQLPAVTVNAPGWLGVEGKDLTVEMAESHDFNVRFGVLVRSIAPQSPAQKAGLKRNDVISEMGGQVVHNIKELRETLARHRPGETVEFVIWVGGRTRKTVPILLEHLNQEPLNR